MTSCASPSTLADANKLCTQCGLCCDGTFFGSVLVGDDEPARLTRVGLRVVQQNGTATLPQPCTALRDGLCGVYTDRPSACARYECLLRKGVSAGTVGLEDAFVKVARMRELLAFLLQAFEGPPTSSLWERILALEEPSTAEAASAAARRYEPALAAVGELLELGRDAFEPRFSGGSTTRD